MALINLDQTKVTKQLEEKLTRQVQKRLDNFAQSKGYDDAFTCITYEGDGNPTFAAEAATMKQLRSDTWTQCNQILADVKQGNREAPLDISEIESELPVLSWG
jgi:hypothetical protein